MVSIHFSQSRRRCDDHRPCPRWWSSVAWSLGRLLLGVWSRGATVYDVFINLCLVSVSRIGASSSLPRYLSNCMTRRRRRRGRRPVEKCLRSKDKRHAVAIPPATDVMGMCSLYWSLGVGDEEESRQLVSKSVTSTCGRITLISGSGSGLLKGADRGGSSRGATTASKSICRTLIKQLHLLSSWQDLRSADRDNTTTSQALAWHQPTTLAASTGDGWLIRGRYAM